MAFKKIKVVPVKTKGHEFKTFEIEVKDHTLQDRAKLNDKIMDKSQDQNFSFWLSIIKESTKYTDDELNAYSLDELVSMSSAIIETANKKKLKK